MGVKIAKLGIFGQVWLFLCGVCLLSLLLQVVVEVADDAFVEVYALVTAHVVGLAWVYEEVGLGAGGDARFQERVGVLWEHHGVV